MVFKIQSLKSIFLQKRKYLFPVLFLFFFLSGLWTGKLIQSKKIEKETAETILREPGNYQFISPLLDCEAFGESLDLLKNRKLKEKIENFSEEALADSQIKDISIYFRDLNTGSFLGVNEDEEFTPASLLKVPVLIAILKKAEEKPGILSEKIIYKDVAEKEIPSEDIKPQILLKDGAKYSLEEIVKNMIIYSSNRSTHFLAGLLDTKFLDNIYLDLGIEVPGSDGKTENFMKVKDYASFFRILYNSSYLNREMSEKALSILAQSRFVDGLVAGVPKNVIVAHKFGERTFDEVKQLHDCGIVYNKKSPYLLCIMTRGENFTVLTETIKNISAIVYEEVTN